MQRLSPFTPTRLLRRVSAKPMHRVLFGLTLTCVLGLAACEPEAAPEQPVDPNQAPESVGILRDNSQFDQRYDLVIPVSAGVNSLPGSLEVIDFSVDQEAKVNFLYETSFQSQQDRLYAARRRIVDLNTNLEIPVADDDKMLALTPHSREGYERTVFEFFPYSARAVAFETTGTRSGFYGTAYWGGAVGQVSFPQAPSSAGYSGGVGYNQLYSDFGNYWHWMVVSPNAGNNATPINLKLAYRTPAMNGSYLANFPEPRLGDGKKAEVITVYPDSIIAYQIDTYQDDEFNGGSYTLRAKLSLPALPNGVYSTLRHYSKDGQLLAMLMRETSSGLVYTFTYNLSTGALAAVLPGVDLPGSAEGSDIDLDELGNVYYSARANQGTGEGVSIYQRSVAGVKAIGAENFLKFGTISKLRVVDDKVYLSVVGSITGRPNWWQISLLVANR